MIYSHIFPYFDIYIITMSDENGRMGFLLIYLYYIQRFIMCHENGRMGFLQIYLYYIQRFIMCHENGRMGFLQIYLYYIIFRGLLCAMRMGGWVPSSVLMELYSIRWNLILLLGSTSIKCQPLLQILSFQNKLCIGIQSTNKQQGTFNDLMKKNIRFKITQK